jgi:hypothetical protein
MINSTSIVFEPLSLYTDYSRKAVVITLQTQYPVWYWNPNIANYRTWWKMHLMLLHHPISNANFKHISCYVSTVKCVVWIVLCDVFVCGTILFVQTKICKFIKCHKAQSLENVVEWRIECTVLSESEQYKLLLVYSLYFVKYKDKYQSFFLYQLIHKSFVLKEILKFTLKMLRHVSI